MTNSDPSIPALTGFASMVAAVRAGVLVPAPTLPPDQALTLQHEIGAFEHGLHAAFGNVSPLIPATFTASPPPSTGDRGKAIIALAAACAFGAAARRIFNEHDAACPPELIFARYNAIRAYESACEMFAALDPAAQVEVNALVLGFEGASKAAAAAGKQDAAP